MATKIQIKRGLSNRLSLVSLSAGEPAFTTDTGKLYIGTGRGNVLVNPIGKPNGIVTSKAYSKIKVNEYGQVVHQTLLSENDIPTLSSSKIKGLGTIASINTGLSSGQIPTLDRYKKFPMSTIPRINGHLDSIYAYYSGADINIPRFTFVQFRTSKIMGNALALRSDGSILFKKSGTYIINYNITSKTKEMAITLAMPKFGSILGTMCQTSSNQHICTCSGTLIRTVSANTIIGVKNVGRRNIIVPSGFAGISAVKIS